MPLPPCALISSTRALSGPLFVASILTGMHLQHDDPGLSMKECHATGQQEQGSSCTALRSSCAVFMRTQQRGARRLVSISGVLAPVVRSQAPGSLGSGWASSWRSSGGQALAGAAGALPAQLDGRQHGWCIAARRAGLASMCQACRRSVAVLPTDCHRD